MAFETSLQPPASITPGKPHQAFYMELRSLHTYISQGGKKLLIEKLD